MRLDRYQVLTLYLTTRIFETLRGQYNVSGSKADAVDRSAIQSAIDAALTGELSDPRCTCGLVRRSVVPEEHDDSCPVVAMYQREDTNARTRE